jgi:hypothetical protein
VSGVQRNLRRSRGIIAYIPTGTLAITPILQLRELRHIEGGSLDFLEPPVGIAELREKGNVTLWPRLASTSILMSITHCSLYF